MHTLDRINADSTILPNITLGCEIRSANHQETCHIVLLLQQISLKEKVNTAGGNCGEKTGQICPCGSSSVLLNVQIHLT